MRERCRFKWSESDKLRQTNACDFHRAKANHATLAGSIASNARVSHFPSIMLVAVKDIVPRCFENMVMRY